MLNNIKRFAITADNQFVAAPVDSRGNATVASVRRNKNLNYQTEANSIAVNGGGGGYSVGYSSSFGGQNFVGLLEGFIPEDARLKNRIFHDIYKHDAVAGAAVEINATMPFSDFYLTGLKDREVIDIYRQSVEKMRMKIMLPAISRDYLISGRFIGTSVFSKLDNMFSAIMPQDSNSCELIEVPIYGTDPLINLIIPDSLKKLLKRKNDPRVQNLINNLPENIRNNINQSYIPLDPASTLFIPRRTITSDSIGTSFYERILPIHIMEKAMIRGSIDQVQRRQRAILHIQVSGDGDDYVPTIGNLESIRDLFSSADNDPTGAIIVTHSGVNPNEIRDAGSFFRADELFEYFNSTKYKALGISEAMITGEANFNAMDATLSLFIENLREYRAMLTREIFYEKIFPAIAIANDFVRSRYTVTGQDNIHSFGDGDKKEYMAICAGSQQGFNIHNANVDVSELAMPIVSWQKHLRPEGDTGYMDLLSAAEQHGVPIPLAMMASAAGVDINAILNNMDQEIETRKRVQKYNERLADFIPQQDGQSGGYSAQAALQTLASKPSVKPISWLTREYDERTLPHEKKKNGSFRPISAKRQKQMYGDSMKILNRVLKNQAKQGNL